MTVLLFVVGTLAGCGGSSSGTGTDPGDTSTAAAVYTLTASPTVAGVAASVAGGTATVTVPHSGNVRGVRVEVCLPAQCTETLGMAEVAATDTSTAVPVAWSGGTGSYAVRSVSLIGADMMAAKPACPADGSEWSQAGAADTAYTTFTAVHNCDGTRTDGAASLSAIAVATFDFTAGGVPATGGGGGGTGTRHFTLTAPPTCALVDGGGGTIGGTCTVTYSGTATFAYVFINDGAINLQAVGEVTGSPATLPVLGGTGAATAGAHPLKIVWLFDFDPNLANAGKFTQWIQNQPSDTTYTTWSWSFTDYDANTYSIDEMPTMSSVPVATTTY